MSDAPPVFIGYAAKRRTPGIASVSECIAKRPRGWIDLWTHNDWGFYDTFELAEEALGYVAVPFDWPVMAYALLPIEFGEREVPLEVVSTAVPQLGGSERLGWDVVSKDFSSYFECSPLSCNGMASEVAVNELCLLKTREEAIAFARRCAREQPEPGRYFVVEVWCGLFAA